MKVDNPKLRALSDREFNDLLLRCYESCRMGKGLCIPYPISVVIAEEMERRDPSGTWTWGVEGGPIRQPADSQNHPAGC